MPDGSALARAQVHAWADAQGAPCKRASNVRVASREVLPHRDIAILRGIEGARVKELYRITADQMGVKWTGRRYDRQNRAAADMPTGDHNAASAVKAPPRSRWLPRRRSLSLALFMRTPARVSSWRNIPQISFATR